MLRPDPTKENAPVVRGAGEAAVQGRSDGTNDRPQGATIAQRRADSIRLQAIGQIGGA